MRCRSFCGKSTLLNIISLLTLWRGKFYLMERCHPFCPGPTEHCTGFPVSVIYDTMTVYDNLAFPLRNRVVDEEQSRWRVRLLQCLNCWIVGHPCSDWPQIPNKNFDMGLVRENVNAVIFNMNRWPQLIHLKWKLRSKLKSSPKGQLQHLCDPWPTKAIRRSWW